MAVTETYLIVAAALAFGTIAILLLSAPSLHAGANRLKLLMNTLGVIVVAACALGGIALLGWGLASDDTEIVYLSFMPFAASLLTWNFITRRHQTWWGIFGANDSRERSRAFWKETFSLWRGRDPDEEPASPRTRWNRDAADDSAHSFSFSINLGGTDRGLGSLLQFGAHRLSTQPVSVFPNMLQFAIVVDESGKVDGDYLRNFRQEITIRRDDGGPLTLRATSDLPFLTLQPGPAGPDGTCVLAVGLRVDHLPSGSFGGAISVETGDIRQPTVAIPVIGEIASGSR